MGLFTSNTETTTVPAKAKIVIVKGGSFAQLEESSSLGMDSVNSAFGSLLDESDMAEIQKQSDAVTEALGDSVFNGYKDNEVIEVQMNPTTYSIKSSATFKPKTQGGAVPDNGTFATFTPPEPKELSVRLLYDMSIEEDYFKKLSGYAKTAEEIFVSAKDLITGGMSTEGLIKFGTDTYDKFKTEKDLHSKYLEKLLCLTRILKGIYTPPLISFVYGSVTFEGYVKSVDVQYKKFSKVGEVSAAEVSLIILESNPYAESVDESKADATSFEPPSLGNISEAVDDAEVVS